jgi:2-methylisocitrate lyase-like PEP mutase family enzyme
LRVSKTSLFRQLHQGPKILVLPNAWDAASARIFEAAGFPALATTSAGVANSLGYADGQRISREEMLQAIGRIVKAVSIPVTGDVESGYDDPLATAQGLADLGAVGMNLEDTRSDASLVGLAEQVKLIESVRSKTDLVINARTDTYLYSIGDPATLFERTVERLKAYGQAGADSLFVPGLRDPAIIGRLTGAIDAPLNILAVAGTPPIAELERLGVRRVTIGSGAMRATMGLTQRIAEELRDRGTYTSFTDGAIDYVSANRLFLTAAK